jgi:hypothetical protein
MLGPRGPADERAYLRGLAGRQAEHAALPFSDVASQDVSHFNRVLRRLSGRSLRDWLKGQWKADRETTEALNDTRVRGIVGA